MAFINRLIFICWWICYCFTGFNSLDNSCLNGPDFWCLNSTTEMLCDFTNKTIGICGYSNKRCEVKTGKMKFYFL